MAFPENVEKIAREQLGLVKPGKLCTGFRNLPRSENRTTAHGERAQEDSFIDTKMPIMYNDS